MKLLFLCSIFVIFNFILAAQFSNQSPSFITRIVGGKPARSKQFPYQVFLDIKFTLRTGAFCGGSLISKNYVLTAAHCVYVPGKMSPSGEEIPSNETEYHIVYALFVILGVYDLNSKDNLQKIHVTKNDNIVPHREYNPDNLDNDIALIRLPYSAKLNEFVQAIKLPPAEINLTGKTAIASGWGVTDDMNRTSSNILRYVNLPIISNERCYYSNPTKLCTTGQGKVGTCSGDSGGPLVYENISGETFLVGITSAGSKDCEDESPSYYTRISEYLDWIYERIQHENHPGA